MRSVSEPPPTPYPDVNRVLFLLKQLASALLDENFLGMYLYGSLASGDFDPLRSDIDFVIVTQGVLPGEAFPMLQGMHQRLYARAQSDPGLHWAVKLEGAYVPADLLRRHQENAPACPTLNEGQFYLAPLGGDWIIQRHVLRTLGVVVTGPPPADLIDPVSPEEIKGSVRAYLQDWWQPMMQESSRLESSEYQAYAVLSMCRALYTLATGEIASKSVSARWAQLNPAAQWSDLIDAALAWQPGMEMSRVEEVKELIRLACAYS
jgi:hypothetical protein